MAKISKPMLAGKSGPMESLTFPLLATPKLDGIRCLVVDGRAVSRKFLPIPNDHIRKTIQTIGIEGLDGEILVKGRTFNELSGDVRRVEGTPDFVFAVFDLVTDALSTPYRERMARLRETRLPSFCEKILPVEIHSLEELTAYEAKCIADGYEGTMTRTPNSPYKCGRSSTKEAYLLKIKRFEDAEALIIAAEEMMHNDNVAQEDAFGRTKRSSNAENLRPAGVLGKLVCRLPSGVEFEIGTGFTAADRANYWAKRGNLIGKQVKFKHQPSGADVKPRFPVFLGFRDAWDM
jgi:DNA ligase-1